MLLGGLAESRVGSIQSPDLRQREDREAGRGEGERLRACSRVKEGKPDNHSPPSEDENFLQNNLFRRNRKVWNE